MPTHVLRSALAAVVLSVPLLGQSQVIQPSRPEKTTEIRTLALPSGSTLRVANVNGFIHVATWDREDVQFTGEFKPSSKDEQVKVVIESGPQSLEVRGEYPKHSGWGSYRGPACDMTLKVPRKVAAILNTVNGEITLEGTGSAADVSTVNGSVHACRLDDSLKVSTVNGAIHLDHVRGGLSLHTVNGDISGASLEGHDRGIQAETVNGSVRLQLAGIKGRLKATTVNGGIAFNAKGAEQVEVKKNRVSATFSGGDKDIQVGTVNGRITLD